MLLSDLLVGVLALIVYGVFAYVFCRKHEQDTIIEQRKRDRAQRYR